MKIEYFTPETVDSALELKATYGSQAVWFAGGSKLNAASSQIESTDAKVFIALDKLGLDHIKQQGNRLTLGAMSRIQDLIDSELVPASLKQSAAFIYSRHLRNQATLGGEIAAKQCEAPMVPVLMALNAQLVFVSGKQLDLEQYIQSPVDELIQDVVIPDVQLAVESQRIARNSGGLRIVNAAVSVDRQGKQIVAIEGVTTRFDELAKPMRLRDVEGLSLSGEALEAAIKDSINAVDDICGSAPYKNYLCAVVICDLLTKCRQMAQGAA